MIDEGEWYNRHRIASSETRGRNYKRLSFHRRLNTLFALRKSLHGTKMLTSSEKSYINLALV